MYDSQFDRLLLRFCFFFSSRRRHTRSKRDWSSDVCSSDLPEGERARRGDVERVRPWRSVTKTLTGCGAVLAVQEGRAALEDPAGPPGATLRHLLSHASGCFYDSRSEEHTSELQSRFDLVCRLLLEK